MTTTRIHGQSNSSEWSPPFIVRGPNVHPGFRMRFQHEEKDADTSDTDAERKRKEHEHHDYDRRHEPSEGDEGGGGSYSVRPPKDSNPMGWGVKEEKARKRK